MASGGKSGGEDGGGGGAGCGKDGGWATGMFWMFLGSWAMSFVLFIVYGEVDFSRLDEPTGPHGIGVKRIWSQKHENHILAYYPISKSQWQKAHLTPNDSFLPYYLFGHPQLI